MTPDRVHGRQVHDVESEAGEVREHLGDTAEPAPRAREQLVPGPEPRKLTIDVDGQCARHDFAVAVARIRCETLGERRYGTSEQHCALRQLAGEILLPRLDLPPQLVLPGGDAIRPGSDAKLPAPRPVDGERTGPAVVAEVRQRFFTPARFTGPAHAHRAAERVMPVLEDGRVDLDAVAHRALDRIAAAVEDRLDRLDLDPWLGALGNGHRVRLSVVGSS